MATSLPAHALRGGVAFGPWSDDAMGWVGYSAFSDDSLTWAGGKAFLPSFEDEVKWGPSSASMGALSLSLRRDDWDLLTLAAVAMPLEVPISYGANEVSLHLQPTKMLGFSLGPGLWRAGLFMADIGGDIMAGESLLGDFQGQLRGGFAGTRDLVGFLLRVDSRAEGRLGFLDLLFLGLDADLRGQALGIAGQFSMESGNWGWGGWATTGLVWLDGQLTLSQRLPQGGVLVTTGKQYNLVSAPAVFIVFRPEVFWKPSRSTRLALSRWVPWASWTIDSRSFPAKPDQPSGNGSSQLHWSRDLVANLLVLGWNLEFTLES